VGIRRSGRGLATRRSGLHGSLLALELDSWVMASGLLLGAASSWPVCGWLQVDLEFCVPVKSESRYQRPLVYYEIYCRVGSFQIVKIVFIVR
jgi:hypothetical protein